jgi:F-type H+-transporting ATPase subunit b
MGSFLVLMVEASAAGEELAEGGFGLNTNIFDTNLINLAIIITVLLVFGRKVLGGTLKARRENIETAIKTAESRVAEAKKALDEQQRKLAQAQAEAERIRLAAVESARKAKDAILAQAAIDVERMKETANADVNSERDRAIAQLRSQVVVMALNKVESELGAGIGDDAQQTLIDRSLASLGGR